MTTTLVKRTLQEIWQEVCDALNWRHENSRWDKDLYKSPIDIEGAYLLLVFSARTKSELSQSLDRLPENCQLPHDLRKKFAEAWDAIQADREGAMAWVFDLLRFGNNLTSLYAKSLREAIPDNPEEPEIIKKDRLFYKRCRVLSAAAKKVSGSWVEGNNFLIAFNGRDEQFELLCNFQSATVLTLTIEIVKKKLTEKLGHFLRQIFSMKNVSMSRLAIDEYIYVFCNLSVDNIEEELPLGIMEVPIEIPGKKEVLDYEEWWGSRREDNPDAMRYFVADENDEFLRYLEEHLKEALGVEVKVSKEETS